MSYIQNRMILYQINIMGSDYYLIMLKLN